MERIKFKTEEERQEHKKLYKKKWYAENREVSCQKARDHYWKNKKALIDKKKAYYKTDEGRAFINAAMQKSRDELDDSYIRSLIKINCKSNGILIRKEDITPEQIAIQRKIVWLKRTIKSHRHEK
jgi:hypothetical protein